MDEEMSSEELTHWIAFAKLEAEDLKKAQKKTT